MLTQQLIRLVHLETILTYLNKSQLIIQTQPQTPDSAISTFH